MAAIISTFASPTAGRLTVALQGTFFDRGVFRDSGFPAVGSGTPSNISVKAYVGPSGSPVYGQPIDRYAPFSSFEVDYPGGNALWTVGTFTVGLQRPSGTLYSYGMANLNITLTLKKR